MGLTLVTKEARPILEGAVEQFTENGFVLLI